MSQFNRLCISIVKYILYFNDTGIPPLEKYNHKCLFNNILSQYNTININKCNELLKTMIYKKSEKLLQIDNF